MNGTFIQKCVALLQQKKILGNHCFSEQIFCRKQSLGAPDLISKRIKEILTQKHQYNAKYSSQFNDKNAFRKYKKSLYYFFQISAVCIGICAYMHATFLLVEIADRFLGQALYRYHFVLLFLFQPPLKVCFANRNIEKV